MISPGHVSSRLRLVLRCWINQLSSFAIQDSGRTITSIAAGQAMLIQNSGLYMGCANEIKRSGATFMRLI
jgi:hypothetical protein